MADSRKKNSVAEEPLIGIITALPEEYTAMQVMLEHPSERSFPGPGAGRRYLLGSIPAKNGGKHRIALMLLPDMGNNPASIGATLLLEHFPAVESIILVGIAGGVPHPEKPNEHVRLGDIVVSNRNGVVQYNLTKETITETEFRHPPRPPSAKLLEAVRILEANQLTRKNPYLEFINQGLQKLNWTRPPDETDVLASSANPGEVVPHPQDAKRKKGQPRVFFGPIASANLLLKNPRKRDELRDKFGVKAVEMEGAGIADATWNREIGYLVVRGVCDYCDMNKGDDWQACAAINAAAYTRALIESISVQPVSKRKTLTRLALVLVFLIAIIAVSSFWKFHPGQQLAPLYQVYVRSEQLPVKIFCDNYYRQTLNSSTPATTLDLEEGEHIISARWAEFKYEKRISLSREKSPYVVVIPRKLKAFTSEVDN